MRELNEIEKKIIIDLALNREQQQFVHSHIVNVLGDCLLQINRDNNSLDIVIFDIWENKNSDRQDEIIEIAYDKTNKIITVINFIKYLESNGYILTGNFAHGIAVDPKYAKEEILKKFNEKGHNIINWSFTDNYIKQLILNSIDLNIFPTEELRSFVKNNFKTREDIKHSQTIKVAWTAIIVSIILGLTGVFMNISNVKNNNDIALINEKKINTDQVEDNQINDSISTSNYLKNKEIQDSTSTIRKDL